MTRRIFLELVSLAAAKVALVAGVSLLPVPKPRQQRVAEYWRRYQFDTRTQTVPKEPLVYENFVRQLEAGGIRLDRSELPYAR